MIESVINIINRIVKNKSYKSIFAFVILMFVIQQVSAQWTQMGMDIDGESVEDKSGNSVSMNLDGTIIAIGGSGNDGGGSNAGHVRVFSYIDPSWIQIGNDIDGESAGDGSGVSVSLSSDGYVLAIGAAYNNGNGNLAGHVRIFEFDGSSWIQQGSDIDGENANDRFGNAVSLSADGSKLAVGAPLTTENGSNTGHVRVFTYDGSDWIQMGENIVGDSSQDFSGSSVSISSDGNTVAIGSWNSLVDDYAGYVKVFAFDGTSWLQKGEQLVGEAPSEYFGWALCLSSDGSILAVGAHENFGSGPNSGNAEVYEFIDNDWVQIGEDIDGEAEGDFSGYSVGLSSDGSVLAIGAPGNDGNGEGSGSVQVYVYDGMSWVQQGDDLDGEFSGDGSGAIVSISGDGSKVGIAARLNDGGGENAGHVRVYSNETLVSISENSFSNKITLNPNPTKDIVTINLGDEQVSSILILNELGQIVTTLKEITGPQQEVSISGLTSGLYFVQVESAYYSKVMKLIKE